MTTDDFGSVVYPGSIDNGAIDTEHSPILYPPKSDRICAADERFASVNEAIGLLDYKLEQHITQCADGLAPLADFISSSWAVIDELEARIAALEAAQPIPQISRAAAIDDDALTATYMVGREEGKAEARAARVELEDLRAKWASVPWEAMDLTLAGFMQMVEEFGYKLHPDDAKMVDVMLTHAVLLGNWYRANAPKEAAE